MKAWQLVPDFQIDRTIPCRLISPGGEEFIVLGLQAFAILFDLPPAGLKATARKGGRLEGWAVEQLRPEDITEVETFWNHPELAERMKVAKRVGKFRKSGS